MATHANNMPLPETLLLGCKFQIQQGAGAKNTEWADVLYVTVVPAKSL